MVALPSDITDSGHNQDAVTILLQNLVDLINELQADHATSKTTVDALVTLTTELRTDHATTKTAVDESKTAIDELIDDHDTNQTHLANIKTLLNRLRTDALTKCITPPNFEIDTNFDVQNGDAFEITSGGVQITVATDVNFDTGTATTIATNAYWAGFICSIDVDGTTTYVDWGAEDVAEAGAITNLAAVTASGEVVCGYVTVHAKAGEDFVAGTDALTTGTGGQVAQATNYFNAQVIGDAALGAAVSTSEEAALSAGDPTAGPGTISAAAAAAGPATLTNSTALTLLKG